MAQTTGAISFRTAVVKISSTDTAWASMTDLSGSGAGVAVAGGDRVTGEEHTLEGDIPVVVAGKRGSIDVTVRCVYTEGAAEAFETARAIYETAGGAAYVMWNPKGTGDSSNFVFDTGAGIMTNFKYPEGDAEGGEVVMGEFAVKCASITKTSIGSA